MSFTISVTRFDKISPPLLNFISVLQGFEGIINIWQNCVPTLATFYAIGQKFIGAKGQILLK